tara:strand:- start:534 stop:1064 length:531 start_codon:yes stop_codon:yes gene_type:complete
MAIMEAIETVRLEVDTASVTFDSVAGYEHLELRFSFASNLQNGNWQSLTLQFNDDTGSNYTYRQMYAYGASKASFGSNSTNTRNGWMSTYDDESVADTYGYGCGVLTIPDYLNAYKNTTCLEAGGVVNRVGANRGIQGISWGLWDDAAALTKIKVTPQTNYWLRGTVFSLYGIKSS